MIYKKYRIDSNNVGFKPLESKKELLPEVAKAIAKINMSEINDDEKIEPDELVHAVLDEMFNILSRKLWKKFT